MQISFLLCARNYFLLNEITVVKFSNIWSYNNFPEGSAFQALEQAAVFCLSVQYRVALLREHGYSFWHFRLPALKVCSDFTVFCGTVVPEMENEF